MLAFEERKEQEGLPQGDPFATLVTPKVEPGKRQRPAYFEAFRQANNEKGGAVAEQVAQNPNAVLAMQTQAREGKDLELQKKRERFERLVAIRATKNPDVDKVVDEMCQKMVSFVLKMNTDIASQRAAIEALGNGKYTPEPADFAMVVKQLQSGSIREKMGLLGTFQETLGKTLLDNDPEAIKKKMADNETAQKDGGSLNLEELTGVAEGQKAATFGEADIARGAERAAAVKEEAGPKAPTTKAFWSPTKAEANGVGNDHSAYAKAKSEDHDTKLPQLNVDAVKAKVPSLAPIANPGKGSPGLTGGGESSSLVASQKSTAEFAVPKGADPLAPENSDKLELSEQEWKRAERGADPTSGETHMPWIEGQNANVLDSNAEFISNAKDKSMPLKSGISGTTFRFMQTAEILGVDPDSAKMACVGMLQPIEAHSFHEIATAASGFGGGGASYSIDQPYTPESMKPLSEAELTECALEAGFGSLAEANAAAAITGPPPATSGPSNASAADAGDGAPVEA